MIQSKKARAVLGKDMKIVFHSHETAGISVLGYKAALEAGADQIDLSIAPVSGGTCQPDVITMWHALRGTEFDLGVDINKVIKAEEVFQDCMKDYFKPPESEKVEPLIPFSPDARRSTDGQYPDDAGTTTVWKNSPR